ncbi:TadE family protein [Propionicimonas sp.]|uniref:TadE family protein n=1 Tax=Propionicimonas sp. TaxID=1955623 RepID=UPI001818E4D9|nr:TadE family protein [Propionicimonas sp.]MBA3019659.1 pilus assembly protein [Propionicimonas sp.]MBU4207996.1 pilus assembly protein [Actinomycetota bacterium]MBU4411466.1 pilus assembly protein [Actinomycetota bacterium]MCG2805778.1 pilus assembly protein [Propionicimonas sp.]
MKAGERGSAALEMAIVAPAILAVIALMIFAGRYALATQTVNAAAASAARAASIERTASAAKSSAAATASATLLNQDLRCASTQVDVDTSGFATAVGQAAMVRATVTCDVSMAGLIGMPGSLSLTASATSPLDNFRERK